MRNAHPLGLLATFATLAGSLAAPVAALAQCPRQQLFSPSAFADDFGGYLAMNDRHLLVGDGGEHSLCGDVFCANGLVYAYEQEADGQWALHQTIAPADLGWNHQFGAGIQMDGDRALIAAARIGGGGQANYEFVYDGEEWHEVGLFQSPDSRPIGGARAFSGDTAIVPYAYDGLFVFESIDGQWVATHDLRNPEVTTGRTEFGATAAMNDEWMTVGATLEAAIAPNGGAVYMYRRLPDGEVEYVQRLLPPDVLEGPRLGWSVAMQGDELFVGAPNSDRDFRFQGVVHVYELRDGQWRPKQEITHREANGSDSFGDSLSVHGDRLVVGTFEDDSPAGGSGGAYVFERGPDGLWVQAASLFASEPTFEYARRVALWGDTVAIGAPEALAAGEPTGAVDIFDLTCEICPADLDADGSLTLYDFLTFLNLFDAGDAQADFDGDGELTIFDFLAFQTAFDAGCG